MRALSLTVNLCMVMVSEQAKSGVIVCGRGRRSLYLRQSRLPGNVCRYAFIVGGCGSAYGNAALAWPEMVAALHAGDSAVAMVVTPCGRAPGCCGCQFDSCIQYSSHCHFGACGTFSAESFLKLFAMKPDGAPCPGWSTKQTSIIRRWDRTSFCSAVRRWS